MSLDINSEALRRAIRGREHFSERAKKYGVSKQAVHEWLVKGRIPPRALAEIMLDLKLTAEEVTEILTTKKRKPLKKITTYVYEE